MQVQCRKCGGNHFTIKCGIDEKENIQNDKPIINNTYKVKISDFPPDITYDELSYLLKEWGPITQIKLLNYKENSIAYIEFSSEAHAKHLVKALHKTTFDSNIIHVSFIMDKR